MYSPSYICKCTATCTHNTHIRAFTYVHVHMHVHAHTHIYSSLYKYIYTYIHTAYRLICTHTVDTCHIVYQVMLHVHSQLMRACVDTLVKGYTSRIVAEAPSLIQNNEVPSKQLCINYICMYMCVCCIYIYVYM